ncbi:DUF2269 family protein [Saccharococcus caldoxylosilyticus]|jgi:uncharacterized membrane protein|uniref:DUF2269 family protein n=2 Tax=Saccharococcus caldoxylosilyticus TaxID=81408 RepID=A0A023DF03_9BACL|nr:DUF2269 family protein [Parageobacillus caldoxylosilyticus]OQO99114.1 hypothetical protein BSK33_15760 [Geobacillus sp. 44B]KYD04452.1 hypothetical protein B4119_0198 [Parageobacillus caldoxylosilyticus]MBB3853133.1 putative membrane protein [Parageobacillus caldoxylosilyticus]QXJ38258.1 hypothetical protein BV455_01564 [Parageobacillus caldoxylosilyticus]BDG34275.1 hypothetical protein PcaKH15_01810 [Parageobacillus caldoxylosilyticus]
MTTFYKILVFIHIFSAILGMGPGFILIHVVKSAKTMTQLKYAYAIRRKLHTFVMIGGTLLLITGLLMGFLNPGLFQMGWYVTSLVLFLIALAMGPLVLAPKSKPLKHLLETYKGEDIPEEYIRLSNQLFRYEHIENGIFLIIIALMILKPF